MTKTTLKTMGKHLITLGVLSLGMVSTGWAADDPTKGDPFPVKNRITVVDFGAQWCASCPEQAAIMKDLAKEHGDKAAFVVVDIDDYPGIENRYLVEVLPTQIFYTSQGEPLTEHRGALDKETILDMVDRIQRYEADKAQKAKAEGMKTQKAPKAK